MRGGITRANFKKIKEKFPNEIANWEDTVEMWMDLKKVFTKADKKKLASTVVTSEGVQQPISEWVENTMNKLGTKRDSIIKDRKKFREEQGDGPLPEDLKQRKIEWDAEWEELSTILAEIISFTTDHFEGEDYEGDPEEDEDEEDENDGIERIFNEREDDDEEEEEEDEDEDEDEDEEERVSFPPQRSRFGSGLRRRKFVDRTVYFPPG
jgi:hypothetical protein